MPDITPDLVAQVASKLYNQIPGEQAGLPRNSTDSRCIAATLFERAQQETSAIPGGKVPSLGAHADGLVRQQTYIGDERQRGRQIRRLAQPHERAHDHELLETPRMTREPRQQRPHEQGGD